MLFCTDHNCGSLDMVPPRYGIFLRIEREDCGRAVLRLEGVLEGAVLCGRSAHCLAGPAIIVSIEPATPGAILQVPTCRGAAGNLAARSARGA